MDPRLSRRVKESGYPCRHSPAQRTSSSESKLLHVSCQFSQLIEDLSITINYPDMIPTVYEILQNCCPNLKRLKILIDYQEKETKNSGPFVSSTPLCVRKRLSFLKICDSPGHFSELTQLLLNSAPNLTRFKYQGKTCPDLGGNVSIKRIELTTGLINAAGVNNMLDQVKDQLEFLSIFNDYWADDEENDAVEAMTPRIQLPKMKKLKEFRNQMLDLLTCGDKLQDISTRRIPTLRTLRVSTIRTSLDDLLQNIVQEKDLFCGVKNLHVRNVSNPESIAGLKTPFPNLESLSIVQFDLEDEEPLIGMGRCAGACASLGLKYLELVSTQRVELGRFMQRFPNCEEVLSGLKTLRIWFLISPRVNYDLDVKERMKPWFLGMKGLENVYLSGIRVRDETWDWAESFIQENKIPIVFHEDADD